MERYALKPNAERVETEALAQGMKLIEASRGGPRMLLDVVVGMLLDEAAFWATAVNGDGKPRKGQKAAEQLRRDAAGLVIHYAQLLDQPALTEIEQDAPHLRELGRTLIDGLTDDAVEARLREIAEQYPLIEPGSVRLEGLFNTGETATEVIAIQVPREAVTMVRIGGAAPVAQDEPEIPDRLPAGITGVVTPAMQPLVIEDLDYPGKKPAEGEHVFKNIGGPTPVPGAVGIQPLDWGRLFLPPDTTVRPEHRSVSQVTGYENCPLSYRLQRYGEGVYVPGWAAIGGTAFHRAVGEFEAEWWANDPARGPGRGANRLDDFIAKWEEDLGSENSPWERHLSATVAEEVAKHPGIDMRIWHASDGGKENYTWWSIEGAVMLRRYLEQRAEWGKQWELAQLPDGTPCIEIEGMHNVGSCPPLKYAIDLVWKRIGQDTFLIDDLKSGRNRPDDTLQLIAYSDAFVNRMRAYPFKGGVEYAIEATYYHARKAERVMRGRYLTPNALAELSYRVKAMDASERAGHYPPRRSSMCVACSVSASCPVGKLGQHVEPIQAVSEAQSA